MKMIWLNFHDIIPNTVREIDVLYSSHYLQNKMFMPKKYILEWEASAYLPCNTILLTLPY